MGRLGWVMALVVLVVAGSFALFAGGRDAGSGSDSSDDPPLPEATQVSVTEAPGDALVTPGTVGATARVRIEVYGQGRADLTYTLVKGTDVDVDGVTLPWAVEADVDPRTVVRVTAFTSDDAAATPDPTSGSAGDTLLCRVLIDGVLAESLQRPGYTSCSASAEDLR